MVLMSSYTIRSEEETAEIARAFARTLKKGDVVAFYGALGAGKTTFIRGIIQSLTTPDADVPSPTFTLLQTYDAPRFPIYHFDMYRLKNPNEAYELGIEDAFADGVSLIEWPERVASLLPRPHTRIDIDIKGSKRHMQIREVR